MTTNLRKSGINAVGDILWGTHFCQFYETKDDILDLLVPFFKAGLEQNEYCFWIVCEPVSEKEAYEALHKSVPRFQEQIEKKSIEIFSCKEWCEKSGKLDSKLVLEAAIKKLEDALKRGYDGARMNGNERWLGRDDWKDFMKFEREISSFIKDRQMIILCTYPLHGPDGAALLDGANAHERVVTKRKWEWEISEEPNIKKTKLELEQKNDQLEKCVAERTNELAAVIDQLQKEIEERKKAEEKLKQSESLLMEAEHLAHVGSWSLDFSTETVTWSNELYEIFGIQRSTFDHSLEKVMEFSHPDDKNLVLQVVGEAIKTHQPYDCQFRIIRPGGEERTVRVHGAVASDEHGNAVRMYGAVQDITEHKQAGDKLRLAYQRLSYHVENTPLAVIEFDKDLFIKRWSKRAEEIFGWTASEALGKNVYDPDFPIVYEEDIAAVDKISEQLTEGVVDSNLILNRNYTKDGKVIYNEWYNSVLEDEHGKVITILSLILEVTERKKAEQKLNESYEQIRSLSEHLTNVREEERKYIAREIHDELGQQLTVLKMDAGSLIKKIPLPDDVMRKRLASFSGCIDNIVQSVRRISSELRPSMLDDLGLPAAISWHLEQFEKRSGIKTNFREPNEEYVLPDLVKTNVYRILQEALTNIARHSKATEVNVDFECNAHTISLQVSDNGVGFCKEKIGEGNTLGILGMRERAAIIYGTLEIETMPKKGTKLILTAPL